MIRIYSLLILSTLCVTAISCKKECKPKPVSSEAGVMAEYAAQIGMIPSTHTSGILYEILNAGNTNAKPTADSYIAITYVGKFLNGEIFDQQSSPNNTASNPHWPLSGLIEGWKIGIPMIGEGGSMRLLVPSALAYGCEGRSIIPGNTPLFFEVTLVDVQ